MRIGNLEVGGKNPVRIKGMLKSPLADTKKVIGEAKRLEIEGVEAIRIAVKEEKDVKIAAILKKHISLPLAADVHFHPFLALRCIKEGFDQIRLNPLNIAKR
ncbi:MAG: flavodoxin-dependent (E)-4-hydroxy-3-methylbut-2-enyl-diphosphate synthase, partial [Candidatus Omnitrophica bacterium]|nr:flavodoxin-dependent (E)-4-hydroxy-3-methylbut-2-enyl-diphosphate synthase [Candidatus Omnitrophota bacterium]